MDKPEDLNPNGTLFEGQLLFDNEEFCADHSIRESKSSHHMSEINFRSLQSKEIL
jgi:hypothetical protein